MNKSLNLDGIWQLRWHDGDRGDRLQRIFRSESDPARAWPARVPGCVHSTLLAHGVIPDPNRGTNVLACRWVEEMFWHYRRTFRAPRRPPGARVWLVFECLDLAATIYLNGREVGRHANAFYPCRLDVTDVLRPGENQLVVAVESGLFHAAHRSAAGYNVPLSSELTKRPWLRKTQSEHGWDWSPRLLNVGIPGHVRLEIATNVRWEHCVVRSTLSDDHATGTVTARVFVEGLGKKPVMRQLTVSVKETRQRVTVPVKIKPGLNTLEAKLEVARPKLWWPVGHGAQPRYTVTVTLGDTGTATKRIGFRHIRINETPHPDKGRYCILEINGRPIFCKGGNFVPADLLLARVDRRRYTELLDRALEANCNFLRVWGGGIYESADFYELCDARGILVWQEFIFACAKYPATDEHFLADVKREATHQLRRLAHHPSLVIWCGNNELEWANWQWGYERGVAHPDYALFHLVLPALVRQEDPTRPYRPSSPVSPDGEAPNADHVGDQHPWGVGFAETDFRKYRTMICRFPNEGGILGPPALPTLRAALAGGPERINSLAGELHDNSLNFADNTAPYVGDHLIERWTGRAVRSMSLADYVYWGGVVQGAGLAEYVKNFRRRMFDSAAAIFWMFNDVWPCTRSWTIVDHYRRRTPAFWPVRRAFAPVTVVVTREADQVRVYGVNDGAELTGTLRFGLLALAGRYPLDETQPVTLRPNVSTLLAEFSARHWDQLGRRTHVAFAILSHAGREVARDVLFLPTFREMKWPPTKVTVQSAGGQAIFTSRTFAWRVCLDLDGERALPDNFFDVYPGIPTVLDWPRHLGKPRVLRVGN
ncbi:MAG: Exo-beta-D-glucosaminidase [Verrucomicrobiae bacterium]|nr:Exo-beta-D-glucosaminidase [Verrucomicrobiae bacterium]